MRLKLCHLLCFAATASALKAELVTSRLDLNAGQQQIQQKSAVSGPVADRNTLSTPGQSVAGQTATGGITLTPLPQYPSSGSFLATDLFTTRAEANQSAAEAAGSASAISSLQRQGRWRVEALHAGMNGAPVYMQFTFRYSWAQRVQGSGSAAMNLGYLVDLGASGGDAFDRTSQGNGGLTNSDGTDFWTSAFLVPLNFGVDFDLEWTLSDVAIVSSGPGFSSIAKGSAELWDIKVYDSVGTLLVRFVDYDIVENSTAQAGTYPEANGAILPPRVPSTTMERDINGNIVLTFSGDLEESTDLVHWSVIDPTLMGSYMVTRPFIGSRFFRAFYR